MNESTLLDFAELRLSSPSSSRCELYISAEGQTEKLACGFSKTFLCHLRAARDLYEVGAGLNLRLEGPHVYNGSTKPWFTKGTLERFILYVSTPDVLERLKAIEDEIVQLVTVRDIQAGRHPQVHDSLLSTSISVSRAGFVSSNYRPGYCHYSEADSSKKELLRAMDVRLSALQQEQNTAFARAVAAGFCAESIKDLLAFSDFFGADQLRKACNSYYELLSKWQSSQGMNSQDSHYGTEAMELVSLQETCLIDETRETNGSGVCEEQMNSHCSSSHNVLEDASPVRQHFPTNKGLPQRISPRRRSVSPLKKVQLGRFGSRRAGSVAIRSISYFSERQGKERSQDMDTSSSESEGSQKSCVLDETKSTLRTSPETAGGSCVKAAINLFESKQSKDGDDLKEKQRSLKLQSIRGSLDGPLSCLSGKFDLKEHEEGGYDSRNEHQKSSVLMTAFNTDDLSGPQSEQMTRSPRDFAHVSQNDFALEDVGRLQMGRVQSVKDDCSPKEALFFGRGSSMSEDCFTSELDSMGDSRTPEPMESDFSNAKSSITSISHGEVYTDKSSASSESRLFHSTPANLNPSATVFKPQDTQGSESFHQYQATLSSENEPSSCEGNDLGGKDCIMSSDPTIQALADLADRLSFAHEMSGSNEGRFYEHYRRLRDAKMMEEKKSRRAEREAKLRLMEETLELSKAEMDARTAKLNRDGSYAKTRAAKLLAFKANLKETQRVQGDGDIEHNKGQFLSIKDTVRSDSSPPSPPLTPRLVKEQALSPKLHRSRRAGVAFQKATTPPSNSTRSVSVSPKTTPRGMLRKAPSQQISQAAAWNSPENTLECSVPCLSDLKKENTKPSPGKHSGGAHMNSRNSRSIDNPLASSRVSLLDYNGTVPSQTSSSARIQKVDKKNKMRPTKQSMVRRESKNAGLPTEEEISEGLDNQKDVKFDGNFTGKVCRNDVAPIQEVRPFLRKGTGIGPGAGPGVMKLKSEAVKNSDEDTPVFPQISDEDPTVVTGNMTDASCGESFPMEKTVANISSDSPPNVNEGERAAGHALQLADDPAEHSDGGFFKECDDAKLEEMSRDDGLSDDGEDYHTISFPVDLATHRCYAINFAPGRELSHQQAGDMGEVKREEGSATTLSQLFFENSSQILPIEPPVNSSASFRASSAIEDKSASRFSPLKAASLASSSLKHLGAAIPAYFSPLAPTIQESPVRSPASWNVSKVQYASEINATCTHKLSASQKPVVVIPPKEPAKGFKRLLKFGRKSRAPPENIMVDGVSASTPSEGDDEAEEVIQGVTNYSPHDGMGRAKLQERKLRDLGITSPAIGSGILSDKGSAKSSQGAIPLPLSSSQLKHNHAPPGTSMLKAPRSFFSLSTFRSKGSEGRSR